MEKRTIKGIRADLNLTQEEAAKSIGISVSQFQKYETYTTKIPYEVMLKIADLAGIENLREIRYK